MGMAMEPPRSTHVRWLFRVGLRALTTFLCGVGLLTLMQAVPSRKALFFIGLGTLLIAFLDAVVRGRDSPPR